MDREYHRFSDFQVVLTRAANLGQQEDGHQEPRIGSPHGLESSEAPHTSLLDARFTVGLRPSVWGLNLNSDRPGASQPFECLARHHRRLRKCQCISHGSLRLGRWWCVHGSFWLAWTGWLTGLQTGASVNEQLSPRSLSHLEVPGHPRAWHKVVLIFSCTVLTCNNELTDFFFVFDRRLQNII